jgi:hypothetical protein
MASAGTVRQAHNLRARNEIGSSVVSKYSQGHLSFGLGARLRFVAESEITHARAGVMQE